MKTLRLIAIATVLSLIPMVATAQGTEKPSEAMKVSIKAKGDDVRLVLANLFEQAKKNYVLPPNFHFALYLSLEDQPFDRVLDIVCKQTGLVAELDEDVYLLRIAPKAKDGADVGPVTAVKVEAQPPKRVTLPTSVLSKRLTTRMSKAALKDVVAALTGQTEVPIEIDREVPEYRIDAFLVNTSLKYALDNITKAAKLGYRFTDRGSILIFRLEPEKAL